MFPSSSSVDVHHIVIVLHQQHMLQASMSDWVCVIHATPWSTAMQLYDADKSCHLRTIIQGRMRTHTCSWSHRQTNKCGWGFVERVGADKVKCGEELHPLGCLQSPLKKFSFDVSTMSAEAMEREAPCPPSGRQEKRLNELKADIWEARGVPNCTAEESTAESLLDRQQDWNSDNIMRALWTEHHGYQQFFTTVFVHTAERPASLVSCVHTCCALCVCVCLCEWLSWPHKHSVMLPSKSCRHIPFETGVLV